MVFALRVTRAFVLVVALLASEFRLDRLLIIALFELRDCLVFTAFLEVLLFAVALDVLDLEA